MRELSKILSIQPTYNGLKPWMPWLRSLHARKSNSKRVWHISRIRYLTPFFSLVKGMTVWTNSRLALRKSNPPSDPGSTSHWTEGMSWDSKGAQGSQEALRHANMLRHRSVTLKLRRWLGLNWVKSKRWTHLSRVCGVLARSHMLWTCDGFP